MPKMLRVIIIGFAVAALGIMLSVIGYVNGGQNSLVWRDGHFVLPQEKAINQKFDTIKTIDATAVELDVHVVASDKNEYRVKGTVGDATQLNLTDKDGALHIRYTGTQKDKYRVGFNKRVEHVLTVYVPKKAVMKYMHIRNYSGSSSLHDVESKNLTLNNTYGLVTLNGVKSPETTMNLADSQFSAKQATLGKAFVSASDTDMQLKDVVMNDGVVQLNSGNLTVQNAQLTGVNAWTLREGNLDVTNMPVPGLQIQANNGDIKIQGNRFVGSYSRDESATDRLNVVTTDGDTIFN